MGKLIFSSGADGFTAAEPAITAALQQCIANDCRKLDFDQLREENDKTAAEWPDGYIHQAAEALGVLVIV